MGEPTARDELIDALCEEGAYSAHAAIYMADAHQSAVRAEAAAELEGLRAELAVLRDLVGSLVDTDPCDLDHHGYCQAHGWTYTDPACPMARAAGLGLIPDDKEATRG